MFSLYVHRQNYFRDFCAAEGRRRILRIYSKLSIMLEKNDGTKNVPLVPVVSDGRYHVGLASLVSGLGFALSCSSYHRLADSSHAGIPFLQEWHQSQHEFVVLHAMHVSPVTCKMEVPPIGNTDRQDLLTLVHSDAIHSNIPIGICIRSDAAEDLCRRK